MARMQDREVSTLAFHARVLAEASNRNNPLLERANFLGIAASGLQEFVCVRIGSLAAKLRREDSVRPSGMTVSQTLEAAWTRADHLTMQLERIMHEEILSALEAEGVKIIPAAKVTPVQMAALSTVFARDMMPHLDVTLVDEAHPVPQLSAGQVCIAAIVQDEEDENEQLAIVQIPDGLPALVQLAGKGCWITAEDAVMLNLHMLLNGRHIKTCSAFKVLRASHAACKAGEADVRKAVQDCLVKRARGRILRVVCDQAATADMECMLADALQVERKMLIRRGSIMDVIGVMRALVKLPGMDELRYPPYRGAVAKTLQGDLFAAIRGKDHLLCQPYDSMEPLLALLESAAEDRSVEEIHMTIYRVGENSRVLEALRRGAKAGIRVHACVEPRARMDEERNLQLMNVLEQSGCCVYTGIAGLKVHGKALLIVRNEEGIMRRYAHLGTGNYNEATASRYTDAGLLTANEALCEDAARLFACLEGKRETPDLQAMSSSPQGMRQELMRLIRREMEKASRGEPCGIVCMLNALTDVGLIAALTDASRCGVKVDLTVRGACCLIPGQSRETENITVRSVVGRYLEHCRAFAFGGRGQEEVFISSADWMKRSLDRRLELLIPVKDPDCRRKLLCCMEAHRRENVRAWQLDGDEYMPPRDDKLQDAQQTLMAYAGSGWTPA